MTVMVIAGYYITYCYCGVLYNCGYCKVHGMTVMVTAVYCITVMVMQGAVMVIAGYCMTDGYCMVLSASQCYSRVLYD